MIKNIENAKKVFDSIYKNVNVKVILDMEGNYVGRLITKYTKSCAHTILFLEDFIGYEKCSGYGYNMENHNFKNIVEKNKEEIACTGAKVNDFSKSDNLSEFAELNGFRIIYAI